MTTLNREHVTPAFLVSDELGQPCGAVLPGTKPGAAATTPNGRLVSEGIVERRTQSPPASRTERRRSFPYAHTQAGFSCTAVAEYRRLTKYWRVAKPTAVEVDCPPSWAGKVHVTTLRSSSPPRGAAPHSAVARGGQSAARRQRRCDLGDAVSRRGVRPRGR